MLQSLGNIVQIKYIKIIYIYSMRWRVTDWSSEATVRVWLFFCLVFI